MVLFGMEYQGIFSFSSCSASQNNLGDERITERIRLQRDREQRDQGSIIENE